MKNSKKKDKKYLAYIPPDARINSGTEDAPPPKTEYDKRKKLLRREEVKNLTKGNYGRSN